MMIVKSKEWSKAYDEMKRRLYCEIWQYMEELGIEHGFFLDSKSIQNAMETIADRVADLSERVIISEDLIKMHKESEKFKRKVQEHEIKTAMENMSKVDRKLRKSGKRRLSKTNGEVNEARKNNQKGK